MVSPDVADRTPTAAVAAAALEEILTNLDTTGTVREGPAGGMVDDPRVSSEFDDPVVVRAPEPLAYPTLSRAVVAGAAAVLAVIVLAAFAFLASRDDSTTSPTTAPTVTAVSAQPTVLLSGPRTLARGERGIWTPSTSNAVRGAWSWAEPSCPVAISNPVWLPGDVFAASVRVQTECTLVLTVYNAANALATARWSFTVT